MESWSERWPEDRLYALTLGAINQALRDALSERDPGVLRWLFEFEPQVAISRLLGADDEATFAATQAAVARVEAIIVDGRASEVRRWLAYRRKEKLREVFG